MKRWIPVLMQCPIFKNLSEETILHIFTTIPYRTEKFLKGDVLYRAEEVSTKIGIILSGCLEMRKYLPTGNVISVFQRNRGEMLGGSIVFSSLPYPCDVIAKEDSILLWIEKNYILNVFLKNEIIAFSLLHDFSINENQIVFIPFSKTTWAEYLNVSRTSLSRELKIMCETRIIQMHGR